MAAQVTTPKASGGISWHVFFRRYGLLLSLLLMCTVLSFASDRFLTVDNLTNILRQASINGIIAIGMMMVILIRGLDLSVGSVVALATVVAADLMVKGQVGTGGAILVALTVGTLAGLVNGLLVTFVKIPPFIATLGMMTFARGAALQYTAGAPITGLGELGEGVRYLGSAEVLGIPVPIFVTGAAYLLAYLLLNQTAFGRFIYAMGNNERAAYLSGLPVRSIKLFVYSTSGMLAALAGIILMGRLNSAQPTAGALFEFDAIAAVVVGGTSFEGGEGSIWGTLVGVLIIAVLNNGLNLLAIPSFYQDLASGVVIAVALLLYRVIR